MATNKPRRLYQPLTFQATPRLEELRQGTAYLTIEDLTEMFEQMQEGQEGWGDGTRNVTLAEFADWLSGRLSPEGHKPAEILW